VDVVAILVSHPGTDKQLKNIDGLVPKEVSFSALLTDWFYVTVFVDFSALTVLFGSRKRHLACKNTRCRNRQRFPLGMFEGIG